MLQPLLLPLALWLLRVLWLFVCSLPLRYISSEQLANWVLNSRQHHHNSHCRTHRLICDLPPVWNWCGATVWVHRRCCAFVEEWCAWILCYGRCCIGWTMILMFEMGEWWWKGMIWMSIWRDDCMEFWYILVLVASIFGVYGERSFLKII